MRKYNKNISFVHNRQTILRVAVAIRLYIRHQRSEKQPIQCADISKHFPYSVNELSLLKSKQTKDGNFATYNPTDLSIFRSASFQLSLFRTTGFYLTALHYCNNRQ